MRISNMNIAISRLSEMFIDKDGIVLQNINDLYFL